MLYDLSRMIFASSELKILRAYLTVCCLESLHVKICKIKFYPNILYACEIWTLDLKAKK